MAFECRHCGQCCIDECTQINLSIGDIARICSFLKCNIGDIMHKIGMKPFSRPDSPNNFDYELGLSIPCQFRVGEKCSIYPARPLNCRIFPYFFLGNVPDEKIKDVIDPSHKCISEGISITADEKEKYRKYAEFIGNLILEEAKITEQFYEKYNLKQSKVIPAYIFPSEDQNDFMQAKEISKSKIKMAISIMDASIYEGLRNSIQNFVMIVGGSISSVDTINSKEKDILG